MVINYKRLNDNTVNDYYKIPDKDMFLNKLQNCTIYSKFDYNSDFGKLKCTRHH